MSVDSRSKPKNSETTILPPLSQRIRSFKEARVVSKATFALLVSSFFSLHSRVVSRARNLCSCTWRIHGCYFGGGRRREEKKRKKRYRNIVTRWNLGRVHLILNLYRRRGSRHYTPSVRLVSKRTRRNPLPCISIIREQVAFGKFAGRQGDVYTPRRYVTEKRKVRNGVEREREAERRETKTEARSLNYNADEN